MTYHARCRCGAIQIEADGAPVQQGFCHCQSCRSLHGGAATAYALWHADKVRFVQGEAQLLRYRLNADSRNARMACTQCGGLVGADLADIGMIDVFAGLFRDLDFTPNAHLNYEHAILRVADGLPKFKDMPEAAGGSGIMLPE